MAYTIEPIAEAYRFHFHPQLPEPSTYASAIWFQIYLDSVQKRQLRGATISIIKIISSYHHISNSYNLKFPSEHMDNKTESTEGSSSACEQRN
ncbi:hypothetical protein Zm00014a_036856 [Zea mays]|uniref:Uncharacterized protein n=1 Tax=Zea mays TaxID=4577 RepID=A0A3L6EDS0_MAIZE|nr:hypothetical protein Zm00014a_036856 [Zea mays]